MYFCTEMNCIFCFTDCIGIVTVADVAFHVGQNTHIKNLVVQVHYKNVTIFKTTGEQIYIDRFKISVLLFTVMFLHHTSFKYHCKKFRRVISKIPYKCQYLSCSRL